MEFPAMINHFGEVSKDFPLTWVNKNVRTLEKKLDVVKNLLTQSVDDVRFNEAINSIYFMIDKLPLMIMRLDAGAPIFRARPNYGKLFTEQQEISYNIAHADRISAGRFNRPLEPLFYGSLRVENPKIDPVLHCCLEACKELNDEINPPVVQDLTIGCWVNQDVLPVVNLCFDDKHLAGNEHLRKAADSFIAEADKFFSPVASAFLLKFMRFFSELASSVKENENCYYILNAYIYAIRYYYANMLNTAIPGIVYPSAMTNTHGLNIVLVPQAVDYFLELKQVFMQRFFLVKGTKNYISDPCSNLARVTAHKFKFTNVRPYVQAGKVVDYSLYHN
ncbi:hypothetical protein [Mucilaginibacter sp.]|uniref:hypothetical protein n=1 Tax=Mucilaginibacter sp. TaxID=1882438 RepID=UPI0035BC6A82